MTGITPILELLVKRIATALLSIPLVLVVAAGPAQALSPKDAKGCENKQSTQLEDYCTSTGG